MIKFRMLQLAESVDTASGDGSVWLRALFTVVSSCDVTISQFGCFNLVVLCVLESDMILKATNLCYVHYAVSYDSVCKVMMYQTTQLWIFPFHSSGQPDDSNVVWPKHVAVLCSTWTVVLRHEVLYLWLYWECKRDQLPCNQRRFVVQPCSGAATVYLPALRRYCVMESAFSLDSKEASWSPIDRQYW